MLHLKNNSSTEATAEIPAYKQFWPWFLFLLPASAVVAGIITLFIAQDMGKDRFLQNYQKLGRVVVSREAPENLHLQGNSNSNLHQQTPHSPNAGEAQTP